MAAAAVSLACPLRRSTRLAHAHAHPHPHPTHRPNIKYPRHNPTPEPDHEHDSSSSDPENELTPRALRALKRQRLALDPDGLPFATRPRTKKRRKEGTTPTQRSHTQLLTPERTHPPDERAHPLTACVSSDSCHRTATTPAASPTPIPEPIDDPPNGHRPSSPTCHGECTPLDASKPELLIPISPISPDPSSSSSDTEPLTPLTPLTPSPEPSPSLPGHDRHSLPPSPSQDPLPPPVTLQLPPIPESVPQQQQPPTDSFTPPLPPSLDSALDTLIPFDGLHPQFDPELSVQIPSPPTAPQLQGLELQAQFHSFPQHQLYVSQSPVFVRDREINIWKLACQERVDCLLRRYGIDYIKALVESQAHSVSRETRISSSGTLAPPSQTKFRLYTPASYTYSLSSWGSTSGTRKAFPVGDLGDDADPGWSMDESDWVDADIDMDDEDEDDYEDDEDTGESEMEREGQGTLEAVGGLVITDTDPPEVDIQPTVAMDVDSTSLDGQLVTKEIASPDIPIPSRPVPDPSLRPSTPTPHPFPLPLPPPPLTPPTLPPLSSLHVPLLSEPPRAFMGRGTPPDRQRLIEWSGSGRFAANGMGPPLYLSPVPQRHTSTDVGIVPMSVDPPIHHAPSQANSPHTHGEWTSFLYSMLEGDGVGVGVGVGTALGSPGHAPEQTWYELGLASVPPVVPGTTLELPPMHARTPGEHPVDEGNNSSSTLRFALG